MKQNISLVIGDVNIRMYAEHWSKGEFITHHKARTSFGLLQFCPSLYAC